MKKECIISRIEASQDVSPYVYVTFSDPNDYKPGAGKPLDPFGMKVMAFTSPEDLMKNLPKVIGNMSKAMTRRRLSYGFSYVQNQYERVRGYVHKSW